MNASRGSSLRARVRRAVLALSAAAALASLAPPARALDTTSTPSPVTGNATWFYALGGPYGGCGLPQSAIDSQNFVALNVYNTPRDYNFYNRPLTGTNLSKMGMWSNGHNCGRWVRVTIGDNCTGVNDGAMNQPFCRNGSWVSDKYNGATLDMVVADSCGDGNAWCRDDPYHLDLAKGSLNLFVKNGAPVGDMDPAHWNNRHITWQFIPAPSYTGDIQIGFLQGAMTWWGAIAVTHLPNGIHGVDYYSSGAWTAAEMNGDMGQAYLVKPLVSGGTQFQIRVRDASDALVNNGRVYTFSLPASCANQCSGPFTPVSYTTSSTPGSPPPPPPPPGGGGTSTGTCTATYQTAQSWSGGYQGQITVKAGSSAISGWTVTWTLASGESMTNGWNAVFTTSGSTVTAKNAGYNGSIAANGSTSFGFVMNSSATPSALALTCTSP